MSNFECCHYCKPPKRTPGCHDTCSEYLEAKAMFEQKKKDHDKYKEAELYLNHSVMERKNMAAKRKKKNAGYRRLTNSD